MYDLTLKHSLLSPIHTSKMNIFLYNHLKKYIIWDTEKEINYPTCLFLDINTW